MAGSKKSGDSFTITANLKVIGSREWKQQLEEAGKDTDRVGKSVLAAAQRAGFRGRVSVSNPITNVDESGNVSRVGSQRVAVDVRAIERDKESARRAQAGLGDLISRGTGARADPFVDQKQLESYLKRAPYLTKMKAGGGDLPAIKEFEKGLTSVLGPQRKAAIDSAKEALDLDHKRMNKEAAINKLQRRVDATGRTTPIVAAAFDEARAALGNTGDIHRFEKSRNALSSVQEDLTDIFEKNKKDEEEARHKRRTSFGSYISRFSITSAIQTIGTHIGSEGANVVTGGVNAAATAPAGLVGAGGTGLSQIGRSMLIRSGLTGAASMAGWAAMGGGLAISALTSIFTALVNRGNQNTDVATASAARGDLSLGRHLQSALGRTGGYFAGIDYGVKDSDYAKDGFMGIGRRYMQAGNPGAPTSIWEEVKQRRNEANFRGLRHTMAKRLSPYGMDKDAMYAAMDEMGAASPTALTKTLGDSPFSLSGHIELGRRSGVGYGSIGRFLGAAGGGYGTFDAGNFTPGSERGGDLHAILGAAGKAGLGVAGTTALLDQMSATQAMGQAAGLSTNFTDQGLLLNQLANRGMSGPKLGTLSNKFMGARVGAMADLTAGSAEMMKGLELVAASQAGGGTLVGTMDALARRKDSDSLATWEGMGGGMSEWLLASSALGVGDREAVSKRGGGRNHPFLANEAAFRKASVESDLEADKIAYEATGSELASARDLTDALDRASSAVSRWAKQSFGGVKLESWFDN